MTDPIVPVNRRKSEPDLCSVLDQLADAIKQGINCISIGAIQIFYPDSQTADIKLNYKKVSLFDGSISEYQGLVKCPVVVLNGGSAFLSFPIAAGDSCLVLFCDREIDTWWKYGGVNAPQSLRIHDLNDGIALVGIRNSQNPLSTLSTTQSVWSFLTGLLSAVDKTGERLNQPGMVQMYAGATAPSGWLLCDGSAVSRTTYATLYAVIGTTYGVGDGSNTFNLPNLKSNVPIGLDSADSNINALGKTYGEKTHLLTGPESGIQAHLHGLSNNRQVSGTGGYIGNSGYPNNPASLDTDTAGPTNATNAHNNMQPSFAINFIIKI